MNHRRIVAAAGAAWFVSIPFGAFIHHGMLGRMYAANAAGGLDAAGRRSSGNGNRHSGSSCRKRRWRRSRDRGQSCSAAIGKPASSPPRHAINKAVDVLVPKQTGAIVAFGDSVTDGVGSTTNTNNRWPDHLARRVMTDPGNHKMGIVNAGLTGNRLLRDILGANGPGRFDRDVLTQPGVTHLIVLLGNNDIIRGQLNPADAVTTEQIIQEHQMLIERAHLRGLKIYGATLTRFQRCDARNAITSR
jgi:GDSL-like Lipase/Acylhydrolase family